MCQFRTEFFWGECRTRPRVLLACQCVDRNAKSGHSKLMMTLWMLSGATHRTSDVYTDNQLGIWHVPVTRKFWWQIFTYFTIATDSLSSHASRYIPQTHDLLTAIKLIIFVGNLSANDDIRNAKDFSSKFRMTETCHIPNLPAQTMTRRLSLWWPVRFSGCLD